MMGKSAVAIALAALFGALPAVAGESIRIGSFLAVTGPAAFLGDPEKKTLELYVKKLNEEGGSARPPARALPL